MILPAGCSLSLQDVGSIVAVATDGSIEPLVPPGWGVDSNGAAVPVSYSISGTTIVIHVAHRSVTNIAYPVVADPCWKCLAKLVKGAGKTIAGVGSTTSGFASALVSARQTYPRCRLWCPGDGEGLEHIGLRSSHHEGRGA